MDLAFIAAFIGFLATIAGAFITPLIQHYLQEKQRRSFTPLNRFTLVRKRGYVICGVVNHPPMCFLSIDKGKPSPGGIYGVLVGIMEKRSGLPFRYVEVSWDGISDAFADKKCDLVLSVFETSARLDIANFVAPFYTISLGALVSKDNSHVDINCPKLLPTLRYVVCKGEAGSEHVLNDLQAHKYGKVVQVSSSEISDMIYLVHSKRVDVAIADNVTFHRYSREDTSVAHLFVNDPLYLYKNSIMVPKHESSWGEWIDKLARESRNNEEFVNLEREMLYEYSPIIRRIG